MSIPRLSICIPTHDGRGEFLRQALLSVLNQIEDLPSGSVTISISDNASQDSTRQIVREFSSKYPDLISYSRNEINLGFAPNMLRAIGGADGEYAWLLSSDDCIAPDGLRRALETLGRHPGAAGMTVNFAAYDCLMEKEKPIPIDMGLPDDPTQEHAYTSVADALRHCSSVLGYVSGQIVHRELWQQAAEKMGEKELIAVGYFPYIFLIARMLQERPLWVWQPEPLVRNRLDNDSFTRALGNNLIQYMLGNLRCMELVWATFLGRHSALYRHVMRDGYKRYWTWRQVISYKAHTRSTLKDNAALLFESTRHFYFVPSFWILTFPCLLIPHPLFRAIYRSSFPLLRSLRNLRSLRTMRQGSAKGG